MFVFEQGERKTMYLVSLGCKKWKDIFCYAINWFLTILFLVSHTVELTALSVSLQVKK